MFVALHVHLNSSFNLFTFSDSVSIQLIIIYLALCVTVLTLDSCLMAAFILKIISYYHSAEEAIRHQSLIPPEYLRERINLTSNGLQNLTFKQNFS